MICSHFCPDAFGNERVAPSVVQKSPPISGKSFLISVCAALMCPDDRSEVLVICSISSGRRTSLRRAVLTSSLPFLAPTSTDFFVFRCERTGEHDSSSSNYKGNDNLSKMSNFQQYEMYRGNRTEGFLILNSISFLVWR